MTIFERLKETILDFVSSLPTWVQGFLHMLLTDEGKILQSLVETGKDDLIAGGLTTANFVKTAKDILAQLVAQNISTFNLQYIFGLLNMSVSQAVPATPVEAPADTAPVA